MEKLRHIAIILDGNRRYSRKSGLKPWHGHKSGAKKVEDLISWCLELGINELTLYIFSMENFKRGKKETDFLMDLFVKSFNKLRDDKRIHENQIKIKFIGRTHLFSDKVQEAIKELEEDTKGYDNHILNFAMGYGGRAEIVDAVKKISEKVKEGKMDIKDIDENTVTDNLYLQSEPDLLIRPGGESRTSNFLIWQSSYTELWFTDKLWPEFEKEDLIQAINDYNKRERRFGT